MEWFGPKEEHAGIVDAAFEEPAETDESSEPVGEDMVEELQRQVAKMAETLARLQAGRES